MVFRPTQQGRILPRPAAIPSLHIALHCLPAAPTAPHLLSLGLRCCKPLAFAASMEFQRCLCPCASHARAPIAMSLVGPRRVWHRAQQQPRRWCFDPLRKGQRAEAGKEVARATEDPFADMDSVALPENFCIIESRESVKNFADMQLDEIKKNIAARRNRIFLLMEEVRRLRIQQRLKSGDSELKAEELLDEEYPSSIPFFPPVNERTIQSYINLYAVTVAAIILFGGLVAPVLELHMGLGGTSYYEFITSMRLPSQLAEVDPVVASFCGGAVGVLTSLLIVEANNAKMQEKKRCIYCEGTGYLSCGQCIGTGATAGERCAQCAGTGKVMCTACFCTGKQLATEHDPRIDPFNLDS